MTDHEVHSEKVVACHQGFFHCIGYSDVGAGLAFNSTRAAKVLQHILLHHVSCKYFLSPNALDAVSEKKKCQNFIVKEN